MVKIVQDGWFSMLTSIYIENLPQIWELCRMDRILIGTKYYLTISQLPSNYSKQSITIDRRLK